MSLTRFLFASVLLGTAYVIVTRLVISASLPLWLDETWSAMIATRPDLSSFWREAWLDCNPPLYYLFLAGWVKIFGDSDFMLRLPSSLFTIAAAILPALWRPRGLDRTGSWIFGFLILLWQPALNVVVDARGFALLLLLSTASCLVVARMLEQLTLRRGAAWVALGTAMFLTHYYAAVLIVGQGFVLLCRHRAGVLRIWPAAFIAMPGLAWFAYHLPRLKEYARDDVAWYDPTSAWSVFGHLVYVLGALNFISLGVIVAVVAMAGFDHKRFRLAGAVTQRPDDRYLLWTAGAGAIGFAIAIMIGLIQASLTNRYFTPLVPPAMLGLTLVSQRCARREIAGLVLAFSFMLSGLNIKAAREYLDDRATYGYEETSDFVQGYKPDRLLFLWDHPATKIMDPNSLQALGGYFMKRSGAGIPVHPLVAGPASDPNGMLRAAAGGRRPALIWLYDTTHRSVARDYPPSFATDPSWTCRQRIRPTGHSGGLGSIACVRLGDARD